MPPPLFLTSNYVFLAVVMGWGVQVTEIGMCVVIVGTYLLRCGTTGRRILLSRYFVSNSSCFLEEAPPSEPLNVRRSTALSSTSSILLKSTTEVDY
jgi:hypothetical protein